MDKQVRRVIDANFNRVREGLRVCEEFARFFFNDRAVTRDIKKIRNILGRIYQSPALKKDLIIRSRDTMNDVGRKGFAFEKDRNKLSDVFWANIQRSKEALRVLEEFSKLSDKKLSDKFKELRFKTYEIEKKAFNRLRNL